MDWLTATLIASVTLLLIALGLIWKKGRTAARGLTAEGDSLRKQLKDLKASQAQIIHTTKMASLGKMVAGVAHEVNTPLGYVSSNVEVITDLLDEHIAALKHCVQATRVLTNSPEGQVRSDAVDTLKRKLLDTQQGSILDDARALLSDIREGLDQITQIIQDLKGFSRMDGDGEDTLEVHDGVMSAVKMASHQKPDGIKIETEFGEVPAIRCVASQINQVFLNLTNNAIEAMGDEGTLKISTRSAAGFAEIRFRDNGPGIPDEVLPRIFDPFYTTKGVGEGTGLGLSISYKIVQSHGGKIDVRTAQGKGTEFLVRLPIEARTSKSKSEQIKAVEE